MDTLSQLVVGLQIALQPMNFFYCFIGVFLGTLIGVLPGIGPLGGIALLLPLTYGLNTTTAIILLAGIFYGAQYGGSTTSILINIPGEASSIVTCLDGHQMALQGRAGPALGIAAFGSFIAGTLGVIGLMLIAYPLSKLALKLGPPEFFALMTLGIIVVTSISRGSFLKSAMMAAVGYLLSFIGIDPVEGNVRFTFGTIYLTSGLDIAPLVIGLFGISEVLASLEETANLSVVEMKRKLRSFLPTSKDWKVSIIPIFRGTIVGFLIGLIPGGGVILASFSSYAVEKRCSRHPEKFGKGAIEGVAGPESANNAASSACFIPLFSLGLPSNIITAMLLGAMMIHGVQPGPLFIAEHGTVFWGVVASMYIGNIMLLILNLPLIPLWVQVLKIPRKVLLPVILLLCTLGSYSVNNNILDVFVMVLFGFVGYVLRKLQYEVAPICLGFVLGPLTENSFRQSLIISNGSFMVFVTRPITAVIISFTILLLAYSVYRGTKFPGFELE